jgi:hypothetical protein
MLALDLSNCPRLLQAPRNVEGVDGRVEAELSDTPFSNAISESTHARSSDPCSCSDSGPRGYPP